MIKMNKFPTHKLKKKIAIQLCCGIMLHVILDAVSVIFMRTPTEQRKHELY